MHSNRGSDTPMVEIYGPSFSNFVRTVMLICEERAISYTTGFELAGQKIEFKSIGHFDLHPFGKLPVILHDGQVITETSTICRYLSTVFPSATEKAATAVELAVHDAFCAITSIYIDKALIRDYLLEFAFPKGEHGEVRVEVAMAAQEQVKMALSVVDKELPQQRFLNGVELSIADALLAPMLHYISTLPTEFNLLPLYPRVVDYLQQLMSRTACKKVLVSKQ